MDHIDKSKFVGSGTHREVYVYPKDSKLCVKIVVDGSGESRQERREKTYYNQLELRGIDWSMMPKYRGEYITDLGMGSVFELITDYDGSVSKTLEYYLTTSERTELYYDSLERLLYRLKEYLLKNWVVTKTLSPRNIACQVSGSEIIQLYVIDNIGDLGLFPICHYSSFLAKLKIRRRWKRFEHKLQESYPENEGLRRMLVNHSR